ncbi:MAG TPA: SDR family NAD(P)-dependent oxidoreductase [Candidatus Eisenbacteria bacterium]|jgi:serine 3-dehydrogenase
MELRGRWALVTGATSGFGEAIARRLASDGCHVAITGRRADRLHVLSEALRREHGIEAAEFCFDVRDRAAVDRALGEGEGRTGPVEILVNNAGLALALEPLQNGDPADWDQMIDTNVKGLLYVTRAVLPGMAARGRGHVVNIGSVAGHQVYPGGAVYCATKYAVRALSDALRQDVHGTGVRVTNVEPGLAETEFSLVRFKGDPERAKAVYQGTRPLRAEDVAEAVHWCVTRPPHVNVQTMLLMPTDQAAPHLVYRRGA